jgi:hypothetical protein
LKFGDCLSSDLVIEDYLVHIGKLVLVVGSFTPFLLDTLMGCDPWCSKLHEQIVEVLPGFEI